MKLDRVILAIVLVILIFVAIVVLFAYKTSTPGTNIRYDLDDVQVNDDDLLNNSSNPNTGSNGTNVGTNAPQTDIHNAFDDCVALKTTEAQGKQYVRGSLIVSFLDAVRFNTAIDSVRLLGLKADSSAQAEDNFGTYHWLQVSVPSGEEFKWQCKLETSEGVKRATLNSTFQLHE